jgi:hypothetical protein
MPSTWFALSAVGTARDATSDLLVPVDRGRWLRLAVVALFVGVGGGVPLDGADIPVSETAPNGTGVPTDVPLPEGGVAAILAVGLALVLLWTAVGAVMEFVLVVALRDREVRLREPFRAHVGDGLRLFGFRLAVDLAGLLVVGVPFLAVIALGVSVSPLLAVFAVPLVLLAAVIAVVAAVVGRLTTDFVVPAMVADGTGVLDGWRRLWATLRAEWQQVALYVVARFVVGIAASLVTWVVTLGVALAVAVPFALLGAAAVVAGAGTAAVLVVVFCYALVVFVGLQFVQVPVLVFVRYYTLAVLGLLDADLDFVGVTPPDGDQGATP